MSEEAGSSIPPELIEVRSDECFDEEKIARFLEGKLEGSDRKLNVRQFGGGHANLTHLLRYGDGSDAIEYVLRRPPLGPVAKSSHDMNREYRALSLLWEAFPKAPRAYLYCPDRELIGADFFVMERRHGVVVRHEVPPVFGSGRDPVANRKISQAVIDALAEFHAVDPVKIGLDGLGKPEGFLERQVRGWTERYERARTKDLPIAQELSRWLIDNMPASSAWTLLHNDWKLDNMALSAEDPATCVAVYDWDMCTVGDPLCDLGTLLCSWLNRDEGAASGPSAMPTQTTGFMSRDEAIGRYAERAGRDVTLIPYYHVFGVFKMAVVLQQIYFRFHEGQTQDTRFAGMEAGAEGLFRRAAALRP